MPPDQPAGSDPPDRTVIEIALLLAHVLWHCSSFEEAIWVHSSNMSLAQHCLK